MLQLWRSVNKQVCMGHWDTLGDWDSPISLRRVHFIADNSSDETAAEPDTMCLPALVFSARWARGGRHLATFLRHIFRRPRWSYLTSTGTLYNLSLTTVGVSLLSAVCPFFRIPLKPLSCGLLRPLTPFIAHNSSRATMILCDLTGMILSIYLKCFFNPDPVILNLYVCNLVPNLLYTRKQIKAISANWLRPETYCHNGPERMILEFC